MYLIITLRSTLRILIVCVVYYFMIFCIVFLRYSSKIKLQKAFQDLGIKRIKINFMSFLFGAW